MLKKLYQTPVSRKQTQRTETEKKEGRTLENKGLGSPKRSTHPLPLMTDWWLQTFCDVHPGFRGEDFQFDSPFFFWFGFLEKKKAPSILDVFCSKNPGIFSTSLVGVWTSPWKRQEDTKRCCHPRCCAKLRDFWRVETSLCTLESPVFHSREIRVFFRPASLGRGEVSGAGGGRLIRRNSILGNVLARLGC